MENKKWKCYLPCSLKARVGVYVGAQVNAAAAAAANIARCSLSLY